MHTPTTIKEFQKFCDESMFCVCGRLMTGLHMNGCAKLRKLENKIKEKEQQKIIQNEV